MTDKFEEVQVLDKTRLTEPNAFNVNALDRDVMSLSLAALLQLPGSVITVRREGDMTTASYKEGKAAVERGKDIIGKESALAAVIQVLLDDKDIGPVWGVLTDQGALATGPGDIKPFLEAMGVVPVVEGDMAGDATITLAAIEGFVPPTPPMSKFVAEIIANQGDGFRLGGWLKTTLEAFPGVLLSLDPEDYSILSPDGKRTVAHSLAGMGLLPHGHRLWGISVNGWSVAHEAAKRGNTEELRGFIEWGNSDANGDTVAHVLARAGGLPEDCPAWAWDLRNKDGRSVWDEAKTAAVARLSMAVDTADANKRHNRGAFLCMVDKAIRFVETEARRIRASACACHRSKEDTQTGWDHFK